MPYERTGYVYLSRYRVANLERLEFGWTCNGSGVAVMQLPFRMDGQLHRFAAKHTDTGSGTYAVRLYDENDIDALDGAAATLTLAGSNEGFLAKALTTDRMRPISVAGPYWFYVSASAGTHGIFTLYYQNDEVDLQRAGVN